MRVLLSLLLFGSVAAVADEIEDAAARVVAASKSGEEGALAKLASSESVDLWVVADLLCAQGKSDVATALAKAAEGPDFEKLAEFVESCRTVNFDPALRDKLAKAVALAAEKKFAQAYEAAKPLEADSSVMQIRIADTRGILLRSMRKFPEAIQACREAAESARKLGWLNQANRSWDGAAFAYWLSDDYRGVLNALEQRVAIEKERGNSKGLADVLGKQGLVYGRLGQLDRALELQRKCLAVQEEAKDRRGVLRSLVNIAGAYGNIGNHPEAIRHGLRAAELASSLGEPMERSRALNNLASSYMATGESARAVTAMEEVLKIREQLDDPVSLSSALDAMADTLETLGQRKRALEYAERGLAIREKIGDVSGIADSQQSIGIIHYGLGDYRAAIEWMGKAAALYAKLGNTDLLSVMYTNIGSAHAALREFDEAIVLLEKSLELKRKVGAQSGVVHSLYSLGSLYRKAGHFDKAIEYQRQARDAAQGLGMRRLAVPIDAEEMSSQIQAKRPERAVEIGRRAVREINVLVQGLSEEVGATARREMLMVYRLGVRAASDAADPNAAFLFMESGRANSLLQAMGGGGHVRRSSLSEELRQAEQRARTRVREADAALLAAKRAKDLNLARTRRSERKEARDELKIVIQRIQRTANSAAQLLYPEPVSLEAAQRMLNRGDALVQYGLFQKMAYALVVLPDQARVVALGEPEAIIDACKALSLDDPSIDPAAGVAELRRLLVEPLGLTGAVKRVLVSPSGAVAVVPFTLLVGDREVAYVPSATTLEVLRARPTAASGTKILALGDPVYTGSLKPLPHTRVEAERIGDTVLLGKKATVDSLRQALGLDQRWRAIHLACHGLIDPTRPNLSSLALTGGQLNSFDVLGLSLQTDLVVLSACETGRGLVVEGEGILGFTRAFMQAGGPRVLVSLWPVEDEATQLLMDEFYRLWKSGSVSASSALHQAMQKVRARKRWAHPLYWAAWQLWGLPD